MSRLAKWFDSYDHYRFKVGCGFFYSAYRATFYEVMKREPNLYK